jgi:hypothetical protein
MVNALNSPHQEGCDEWGGKKGFTKSDTKRDR